MAIEVDFYLREGQTSPVSTIFEDLNWKRAKTAFASVLNTGGTVTSVSANIFSGLTINVTNPTTTPAITITTSLSGFIKGNGSGFTAQAAISLTTDVTGVTPIANGGTNGSSFTNNRAIIFDGTRLNVSVTTSTELSYVNGVTSAIQTQLNAKEPTITVLPYAKGGTNFAAASRQDLINNLTNSSAATTGWVLTRDGSGNAVFLASGTSGVSSVNGLSGTVTLTVSNTSNPLAWTAGNLNIPTADTATTGLLSAADWNTFSASVAVAGSNTQVQYNNAGAFGASTDFTYNDSTKLITLANTSSKILIGTGSGTGDVSISKTNIAGGVGYFVRNNGVNALSDSYYQASNSDNTQVVVLAAKNSAASENGFVGTTSNVDFGIRANNTEIITVRAFNGFVGIGVAAPTANLDIAQASGDALMRISGQVSALSSSGIILKSYDGSTILQSQFYNVSTRLHIGTTTAHDVSIETNNTAKLYIQNSSGNVGIGTGTSSPAANLEVRNASAASIYAVGSGGASTALILASCNAAAITCYVSANGTGGQVGTGTNNRLDLVTNTIERITILGTGLVGIGTVAPTAYLHLAAGTAAASTAPIKLTLGTANTTGETGALEFSTISGTAVLTFVRSGTTREGVLTGNLATGETNVVDLTRSFHVINQATGAVLRIPVCT